MVVKMGSVHTVVLTDCWPPVYTRRSHSSSTSSGIPTDEIDEITMAMDEPTNDPPSTKT